MTAKGMKRPYGGYLKKKPMKHWIIGDEPHLDPIRYIDIVNSKAIILGKDQKLNLADIKAIVDQQRVQARLDSLIQVDGKYYEPIEQPLNLDVSWGVKDPLKNMDIPKEYELIMRKSSKLSYSQRVLVMNRFNQMYKIYNP